VGLTTGLCFSHLSKCSTTWRNFSPGGGHHLGWEGCHRWDTHHFTSGMHLMLNTCCQVPLPLIIYKHMPATWHMEGCHLPGRPAAILRHLPARTLPFSGTCLAWEGRDTCLQIPATSTTMGGAAICKYHLEHMYMREGLTLLSPFWGSLLYNTPFLIHCHHAWKPLLGH